MKLGVGIVIFWAMQNKKIFALSCVEKYKVFNAKVIMQFLTEICHFFNNVV